MQSAQTPATDDAMDLGDGITIERLGPSHNQQMLDIIRRCPMETPDLDLCFDRQPDVFLLPGLHYEHYNYAGFFLHGTLLGFAVLGAERLHVNGTPETVLNFTDYYLDKPLRGKGLFHKSILFFTRDLPADASLWYAAIIHGNVGAETHVLRQPSGVPVLVPSRKVADQEIRTLLIATGKRRSSAFAVRPAGLGDVDEIVVMLQRELEQRLLGPVVTRESFLNDLRRRPGFDIDSYWLAERNGETLGVCAAWDTAPFKQNRVLRYGRKLKLTKALLGLGSKVLGFAPLPREGEPFKDVHICEYAVRNRDPEIMEALLRHIYGVYRAQRYNSVIFGSSADDPLLEATRPFHCESVLSHVVLGSTRPERLEPGRVDVRLPYMNIGLL